MSVQGRPVHRLIAGSAGPCGVPAPVPEARLVPHQHSIGAESVPVWAPPWWLGYPLPVGGSDELTLHREQLTCANRVTARTTTEGAASGDPREATPSDFQRLIRSWPG